ncbi:hypothetical protein CEUSTIGMA_g315.t1 [Chlamydomonas eustigma]|uniref:Uncharacterized protein n=1 Tax=Chlamydomonas eustigma TaxID=1157962 RepID=A0A250WQN5_9CHLO|nr:hypothetical protein CEUSTIGMA_g315.t1 [Chlamydomonas eustigma]|eukprot:GAX72860.1 hypothetical protein CEUSTIGMA_g315.t1 [Chlamydomonas eustigma]
MIWPIRSLQISFPDSLPVIEMQALLTGISTAAPSLRILKISALSGNEEACYSLDVLSPLQQLTHLSFSLPRSTLHMKSMRLEKLDVVAATMTLGEVCWRHLHSLTCLLTNSPDLHDLWTSTAQSTVLRTLHLPSLLLNNDILESLRQHPNLTDLHVKGLELKLAPPGLDNLTVLQYDEPCNPESLKTALGKAHGVCIKHLRLCLETCCSRTLRDLMWLVEGSVIILSNCSALDLQMSHDVELTADHIEVAAGVKELFQILSPLGSYLSALSVELCHLTLDTGSWISDYFPHLSHIKLVSCYFESGVLSCLHNLQRLFNVDLCYCDGPGTRKPYLVSFAAYCPNQPLHFHFVPQLANSEDDEEEGFDDVVAYLHQLQPQAVFTWKWL